MPKTTKELEKMLQVSPLQAYRETVAMCGRVTPVCSRSLWVRMKGLLERQRDRLRAQVNTLSAQELQVLVETLKTLDLYVPPKPSSYAEFISSPRVLFYVDKLARFRGRRLNRYERRSRHMCVSVLKSLYINKGCPVSDTRVLP